MGAAHHLLFGLLALQNGLIEQSQLVAAFHAWTRDKTRSLADHLVELGHLDADQRAAVEAMVALHLKKHGEDPERSLAAVPAGQSTRDRLANVGDPQVNATLQFVASRSTDADSDSTTSFSMGSATFDGQRFRVLRPHARGGLGAVFVALDEELHREVALKQIVDDHADDPASRHRFLLEAEITGGLEHPGIVPVYGLGSYHNGRPYYAMRFIKGDSLKEAIARFHGDPALKADRGRRSLELRSLLRRFVDVCNAIEYAHARGVLHRDIKPGNVIVGKYGETLVVDWGLAKATGRREPATATVERTLLPTSGSSETLPGSALGTPAYMSPEQASGELDRLGAASDVYSLGATLYCLLTGKAPFEGYVGEVLRKVEKGEFLKPREFDPTIDPGLEAICLKAMATSPRNRYASCRALADDVERWTADEPVSAWREPLTRRVWRSVRKHPVSVSTATVALIVGLSASLYGFQRERSFATSLSRANEALGQANVELVAANEREADRFRLALDAIGLFHSDVTKDLILKEKPFASLRGRLLRNAADFYKKLEEKLQGRTDTASRAALARAYAALAGLTGETTNLAAALDLQKKSVAIQRGLAAKPDARPEAKCDLTRGLLSLHVALRELNKTPEASSAVIEASKIAEGLLASDPNSLDLRALAADASWTISCDLFDQRKLAEAFQSLSRARILALGLIAARPTDEAHHTLLFKCECGSGAVLGDMMRPTEAIEYLERAIVCGERLHERSDPALLSARSIVHSNLASNWAILGRQDREIEQRKLAIELFRSASEVLPNSTLLRANSAYVLMKYGDSLERLGQPAESIDALARAESIYGQLFDEDASDLFAAGRHADCLNQIGATYFTSGRVATAIEFHEKSLKVLEDLTKLGSVTSMNRRTEGRVRRGLGDALLASGRIQEALRYHREAVHIGEALVKGAPDDLNFAAEPASALRHLALSLLRSGDITGASEAARKSVGLFERLSSRTMDQLFDLGCAHAVICGLAGLPGSPVPAVASRPESDAAIEALRRALVPGNIYPGQIRTEPALDPIRDRDDFRSLIQDVAFPTWPFDFDF
jgi:serine/threonine-protein kinase